MNSSLPFDTSNFEELPISIIICEPVANADGSLRDYRIVFGNEPFDRLWQSLNKKDNFIGELAGENNLLANEKFIATPLDNLPAPYVGFILTNGIKRDKKTERENFLNYIKKMEGAKLLMRERNDGKYEAIFVSRNFARMMQCTADYAIKFLNSRSVVVFTHPDDRLAFRRMLRRRVSEDSTKDLTVRQITAKGNVVWCNINFTFIDDFDEHYVYCTFFDVTSAKIYAQRLQKTYMSIGDNFYRANERTLSMFRANLTRNKVEDIQDRFGYSSLFRAD